MGASSARDNSQKIPTQGCRIQQILNPQLETKLQPFTDYIVEPPPSQLKNAITSVTATIFSTLDYSFRQQELPISHNHLGAKIKIMNVNDCSLKVTKVFPNSPSQKLGIMADQYIVGLLEAEFTNLKTFAELLRSLIGSNQELFTLAVCNQLGITRLIPVSVYMLKQWRTTSQGILGCELAEGWMHRFKGKPRRQLASQSNPPQIASNEPEKEVIREGLSGLGDFQVEQGSEEWQQIERKVGGQSLGESLEVAFKGLLKNEYLEDASTICRCKIYDRNCERCWVQREGGYHFFNRRTNRIVSIPAGLLLHLQQE